MELKEQRAKRIEEVKAALLETFRRNNPDAPAELKVEMSPDAAIDMFGLGILDSAEKDWAELIESLKKSKPEPVGEDEMSEEDLRRAKNAKRAHRDT